MPIKSTILKKIKICRQPSLYYRRVLLHLIWQLELGEKNFTGNVWELGGKNLIDIALCDTRIFARFLFHNLKKFCRHHLFVLMLWCDQLEQF